MLVAHHPDAFVAAIAKLAGDDAKRAAMARAARIRAESFAWPLVARRYEKFYEQVVGLRNTA
jgi:glycosyltransferase involved in cell wall biosynthesis